MLVLVRFRRYGAPAVDVKRLHVVQKLAGREGIVLSLLHCVYVKLLSGTCEWYPTVAVWHFWC